MPYTHNDDNRLWYETFGDGEPLVMIMGLSGSVQAWGLQIPELSRHYRLIAPDNRGAGRSDKPQGPYSVMGMAEDVVAVMDAAEVLDAHVMGVSMGGLIAQELYHRHPHRVRSLILGCTGVGPNDPAAVPADEDVSAVLAMDRDAHSAEEIVTAMNEVFYHPEYRARVPQLDQRLIKLQKLDPQPAHAYHAQLEACFTHTPNAPRLAAIEVPTLVLHGEDDRVWPLENAHYLAEHIPGARLHVIPRSGHMFMIEKPREFNAAVLSFLAALD